MTPPSDMERALLGLRIADRKGGLGYDAHDAIRLAIQVLAALSQAGDGRRETIERAARKLDTMAEDARLDAASLESDGHRNATFYRTKQQAFQLGAAAIRALIEQEEGTL